MWPLWIKRDIIPLFDICIVHAIINPQSIGINAKLTETLILPCFNGKYVSHVFTMNWMWFSRTRYGLAIPWHGSIHIAKGNIPKKPASNNKHHTHTHTHNTNTFIKFQLSFWFFRPAHRPCLFMTLVTQICVHQSTTSTEHLSRDALWLIWYLWSAHFMHALAPSCSPFLCLV